MAFDSSVSVNDFALSEAVAALGASLRAARRARRFTQRQVAEQAGIDLATVGELERGRGTLAPLLRVLDMLDLRFADQPPDVDLPDWIVATRKANGWTQQVAAARLRLSKPTIIQVERGRGQVRSLLLVLALLGFSGALVARNDPFHGARLIHGDCLEVMPSLPDGSVNAIISDLPYALTALEWDEGLPLEPMWEQFRRLLKPTGVVVLTASQPFTTILAASNLPWLKYSLVWEKSRATGFLHAKRKPLKKHEDILIFSPATTVYEGRSKRPMIYNPQGLVELDHPRRSRNGVMREGAVTYGGGYDSDAQRDLGEEPRFNGRRIMGKGRHQTHTNYPTSILRFASASKPIHPTQKPVDLMRYLVRTFTNEGDVVLDCCLGSGTTAVAAALERRQCIGIEKDDRYFEMAKQRLAVAVSSDLRSALDRQKDRQTYRQTYRQNDA